MLCGTLLVGCKKNVQDDVVNHMSDVRFGVFVGQTTGVCANLTCGLRENPYKYDGISARKTEFGILEVTLKDQQPQNLHFVLCVNGSTFSGALEENPYNHTFMADIQKIVDINASVTLTLENICENMTLEAASKTWQVQYNDAINLACQAMHDDLQKLYHNRKFCAECYLKIIMNPNDIDSPFYWCFMFVGANGENGTVVIDPKTGQILTQKTN